MFLSHVLKFSPWIYKTTGQCGSSGRPIRTGRTVITAPDHPVPRRPGVGRPGDAYPLRRGLDHAEAGHAPAVAVGVGAGRERGRLPHALPRHRRHAHHQRLVRLEALDGEDRHLRSQDPGLLHTYTGVRGQTAPPLHRGQRSYLRRNLLLIYTEVRGQTSGGTCSSSSQRSDLRRNLLLFHTEQQELHVTQEEVRTCSSQEVRTCSSSTGEGQNLLLTGGGQNLRRNLIHKRGTSC